ncbi:MAG: hypothetical protein NT124_04330 [Candidatus Dependentiae bacterium]|nr:hypothetical protein [Candidatus Dependentiae bacterium]
MQNSILEQARAIARLGNQGIDIERAQQLLMDHLIVHPQDTDAWLLLMCLECNPPLYDQYRIIHYAQHVLSYDPSNAYALLFWSYADHYFMGDLDDDLHEKLSMAHSDNKEVMSMVEVAKARHFKYRDSKKYEEALKKSIEYCSTHRTNFQMLGNLYIKQGKIEEGKFLIEQGALNVKKDYDDSPEAWQLRASSLEDIWREFFARI